MLRMIAIGLMLVVAGCGDDTDEGSGDGGGAGGGAGAGDPVLWECTCFSRASETAPRSNETIEYCAEDDPTEMLSDRYETASDAVDRIGGCDPCDATTEDCDPADNP